MRVYVCPRVYTCACVGVGVWVSVCERVTHNIFGTNMRHDSIVCDMIA